jgi:hypothetical protein
MNPDKNFRIDRSVKRFFTTMTGSTKSDFKNLMISAQLHEDKHKRTPIRKEKKELTGNEA